MTDSYTYPANPSFEVAVTAMPGGVVLSLSHDGSMMRCCMTVEDFHDLLRDGETVLTQVAALQQEATTA